MPHIEGHIEEPQVQGLDYQAIYQKYYDKGFDIEKATRKMRVLYGAQQPEIDGLTAFYDGKKKSPDGSLPSAPSSEEVSTEPTSDTATQGKAENGDTDSPVAAPEPLDSINPFSPSGELLNVLDQRTLVLPDRELGVPIPQTGFQIAQANVFSSGRPDGWQDDYKNKFGEGTVYELNTDKIFSKQRDSNLMAAVNVIEADAFGRWYNSKLKGRTRELVEQYLSLDNNEDLRRQLSDERIPKHALKEGIINMFAALENAPEGQLTHPGFVRKYQLGGDKISKKSLRNVENDFGNFYRDMVKESLPYSVQQNESQLKDLEYYFKYGNGDMFDFTGEGEIGNQTWWSQTQLSAEIGGMTFGNKMAFLGSRIGGWMADTFIGEGAGDVFREGVEGGLKEREDELEAMRQKMNSFESGIAKSYGKFLSNPSDLTSLNNALEQSFYMLTEAAPQIGLAVGAGAAGMGPTGIALLLTADGTLTEATAIRNDISFDDFIDKKSAPVIDSLKKKIDEILKVREGESDLPLATGDIERDMKLRENYKGKELQALRERLKQQIRDSRLTYTEALSQIEVSEGDSQQDIENKLREVYDIETNLSNRTMYLGSTGAMDFVQDRVMFGIFRRAFKGSNFGQNATIRDYAMNLLKGSGVALPESAIPTFLSTLNREYQKAYYTDSDFDSEMAFNNALDITLGTGILGPLMHTGGSSLAYSRHLARHRVGLDGMNAYQRKIVSDLAKKANDPNVTSKDRENAIRLMARYKKEGVANMEKAGAMYDFIGKKDPAALDEIANLTLKVESLLRSLKGVDDPNVKMIMKEELAGILSKKSKLETEFKAAFEAQYDPKAYIEETRLKIDEPDADPVVKTDDPEAIVKADEPDVDPLVKPDDSEAPPVVKKPEEGSPRSKDDTEGPIAEERKLQDIKGGRIRQFFRDTFRSDAGIGGNRGLKFWKRRRGAREGVAETIRGRGREMTMMENQLNLDLNVLDNLFTDVRFDINGKRVGGAEYKRRQAELKKYMNGDDARVAFLSDSQKAKLDMLRGRVDGLSGELIRLLEENPTPKNKALIETIKANQGQYLKRSYEAFTDDGTWISDFNKPYKKLSKNKQKLYNDAVEFLMQDKKIDRVKAELEVTSYLQDLYTRFNNKTFIAGDGAVGALDSKIFSGRKDIPEAFRKLLGEVDDVTFNYVNTVHRMSGYVADMSYQKIMRQQLLDAGLAIEGKGMQGSVELAPGKAFSGLDGLYVDPNFKVMYDSMMPLQSSPSKAYRALLAVQGSVKIGKTVYSPTTTARNILSGIFLGLNAGHLFPTNVKGIAPAARLAWGLDDPGVNTLTMQRDKLTRLGIIGDGVRSGEIMGLLRDFNNATEAQRIASKSGGGKARRAAREVQRTAQKLYAFGDDFYKTTGFFIETKRFMDSGMDRATAEKRAAERIRGGYPTYSYVPRNVKRLRRFPLTGMFVSFPYEVARTTGNNFRYAAQDFAEGRYNMGMQRLIGMGAANAFGFGMHSLTKQLNEYTEEEMDAIRLLGPDWQTNAQPILLPKTEEGDIRFLDATALLPQETIWGPVRALLLQGDPRDKTYMDGIESAIEAALSPYISTDATANLIFEIANNRKKGSDAPIYYYDQDKSLAENLIENGDEIATHIMKGAGPGAYGNLAEFFRANDIAPDIFGEKDTAYKTFSNSDALMALFGFRVNTFDLKAGVLPAIYEEMQDIKDYSGFNLSNKDIRLWMDKDAAFIKTLADDYAAKQVKVAKRMQMYPNVALEAGLPEADLIKTLVNSGISKKNAGIMIANAIEGTELPLNPQYLSSSRMKGILEGVRDAHTGSDEELAEKENAVLEAMFLANVMIIDAWTKYLPSYDINNDEEDENSEFRDQYININTEGQPLRITPNNQ